MWNDNFWFLLHKCLGTGKFQHTSFRIIPLVTAGQWESCRPGGLASVLQDKMVCDCFASQCGCYEED